MEQRNDSHLFDLLKEGDKNALSKLYLKYYDFLLHYGVRIVPDEFLVEECIQEMFIYILEASGRLGNVNNVKAYLFSALRRRILEKIKAQRKIQSFETEIYNRTNIQFSHDEIVDLEFRLENNNQRLFVALNNLPWRQREAIYLRYYNGLSTNEIAEIMGAANQTILNTLYQALKKMRGNIVLKNIGRNTDR